MTLQERKKQLNEQLSQLKAQQETLESQIEQVRDGIQRHIGALQLVEMMQQEEAQETAAKGTDSAEKI